MFWIHGGAFSFGSGNAFLYGPDFFMTENVVLVTINYRMGPLGFLSVGGDGTGNAGLKDQVLALKWVQKNIAAFGGDPSQVTIFGQSAGGASVEYLTLSPMAAGLFHRAIIQSGSVLNPWAFAREPRERAFTLGRKLGLHTNDTKELLTFLRKVTPQALVDAASQTLTPEDARNNIGIPFVPSVEESWVSPGWEGSLADLKEEPFLVEDPMSLLERGAFNKVPMMSGFVTHEAMLFIRRLRKDPTLLKTIDNDKIRLVPIDLNITDGRDSDEGAFVAKQIQRFYMGPRVIGDDTKEELVYVN
jgi:carboxylesterase type B